MAWVVCVQSERDANVFCFRSVSPDHLTVFSQTHLLCVSFAPTWIRGKVSKGPVSESLGKLHKQNAPICLRDYQHGECFGWIAYEECGIRATALPFPIFDTLLIGKHRPKLTVEPD